MSTLEPTSRGPEDQQSPHQARGPSSADEVSPFRLEVRTSPFHGENTGSIPVRDKATSSVGAAPLGLLRGATRPDRR